MLVFTSIWPRPAELFQTLKVPLVRPRPLAVALLSQLKGACSCRSARPRLRAFSPVPVRSQASIEERREELLVLEALWLATVVEAVPELEGVGVKVAPVSREKVKVISAVSPVLTAAVLLEARKKAARSLVEAERMSPKPGLSAPLTLVY